MSFRAPCTSLTQGATVSGRVHISPSVSGSQSESELDESESEPESWSWEESPRSQGMLGCWKEVEAFLVRCLGLSVHR